MDTVLGLAGMALFVLAVVGLAAAITWAVVKLTPAKQKTPDPPPA